MTDDESCIIVDGGCRTVLLISGNPDQHRSSRVKKSLTRRALLMGASTVVAAAGAAAGDYPDRPIRVLVPYPPGDGPDTTTRTLGDLLYPRLRQPFIVDNRPGAGTTVAAQSLSRAAPDGYTLMFSGSTTL